MADQEQNRDRVDAASSSVDKDDEGADQPKTPPPSTSKANPKADTQIETDALTEDRFEATDN